MGNTHTGFFPRVVGSDGIVWFTEIAANKIGKFNPATENFSEICSHNGTQTSKDILINSIRHYEIEYGNVD